MSHFLAKVGVHQEVMDYCNSCPECQLLSAKATKSMPLSPLPLVNTPFELIERDFIVPFEPTLRRCCYIVIMDYATQYLKAIPLWSILAQEVADKLLG